MEQVAKLLEEKRAEIVLELKNGDNSNLSLLKEIDNVVKLIDFAITYNIKTIKAYDIEQLSGSIDEYRLMMDNETNDRERWTEYKADNPLTIFDGDILLMRKNDFIDK